jgi:hypothetical protein
MLPELLDVSITLQSRLAERSPTPTTFHARSRNRSAALPMLLVLLIGCDATEDESNSDPGSHAPMEDDGGAGGCLLGESGRHSRYAGLMGL